MNVLLIATYEMGRQPFGLASPAAWLRRAGNQVTCLDLSRQPLEEGAVARADVVAFYVPMHTATRLAAELVPVVRGLNPRAHLCFYGLYAPVNEAYLRGLGAGTILGGEFEEGLARMVARLKKGFGEGKEAGEIEENRGAGRSSPPADLPSTSFASFPSSTSAPLAPQREPLVSLARQKFVVPDRAGLPAPDSYAHLVLPTGEHVATGYTEASRGCKHLCRHCPVVPVYNGVFRVVDRDVVLEDIRRQVAAGARHITFGDADFFNGIGHAVALVEALHREFPGVGYDVTIKVEHLLRHAQHLRTLRDTGCRLVTTAVESVDDAILARLEKGHTRADFLAVVELMREAGLALAPTFVPFTPWTTREGYCELLDLLLEHGLAAAVAPIQLAIRLLIPAGSRLLELEEVRALAGPFDAAALVYPWKHPDARVDELADEVQSIVARAEKYGKPRGEVFARIREAAYRAAGRAQEDAAPVLVSRAAVPYLNEPWYC